MKTEPGKVSCLLVSYDAERFIEKTLRSCLAQTYADIEIRMLDNASTDRTVEIVRGLNEPRIVLVEGRENVGPYAGLNLLLQQAAGEYVAVQDHDDVWFPDKIEKQVDVLKRHPECVACGTDNYTYHEREGVLIRNRKPFASFHDDYVPHSSLMFRNRGFRYDCTKTHADGHFVKRILYGAGRLYRIPEALVVHRVRSDGKNLSRRRVVLSRTAIREFFEIHGLSISSVFYLLANQVRRILPDNCSFLLEAHVLKSRNEKMELNEFRARHKDVWI